MLSGVVTQGTGTRAAISKPAAGKTGTSQGNRDAWFSGYTCNLTTAVWVGYDDNRDMQGLSGLFPGKLNSEGEISGGSLPADIWGDYTCLLYTSPSPRDRQKSRMPSSA